MRKMILIFLGVLAWSFHMTAYAAAIPAWIAVKEDVSVAGPEILLGDIAEIQCEDKARAARLSSFKVGNAAAPGGKIVLSPGLLRMRLASSGLDYEGIAMNIPEIVTVQTSAQKISGEYFVSKAVEYIDAQMKLEPKARRYTVETVVLPNDFIAPVGEIDCRVKLPNGIQYDVPTNVVIWLYVDGKLHKKVQFRVRLHIYEQVVVTSRSMAAKEVVSRADLHLEDMDTSKLAPGYLIDINRAVGLVMKRVANKGVVVTAVMLDKPVLIQRMAMVNLISKFGGIKVKVEGQALQDGREGDLIRVRNISSNKAVTGRVIDESTVEVMTH